MILAHLRRMARYNRWANARLYDACALLVEEEYRKPRPAFFGSLHGTLCHLLVTDWEWIARVVGEPSPGLPLDHQPFSALNDLRAARGGVGWGGKHGWPCLVQYIFNPHFSLTGKKKLLLYS